MNERKKNSRSSYTIQFKLMTPVKRPTQVPNGVFGMGETGCTNNSKGDGQQNYSDHSVNSSSPQTTDKNSVRSGHSLLKMASEKRARKVRFYRNGDRFFKGMVYAVSTERFRTFESLLTTLTSSALCDKNVLPSGVRHIFTIDGTQKVESLDQLQDGESYVCASTDSFRALDYCKNEDPYWNSNLFPHHTKERHSQSASLQQQRSKHMKDEPRSRSESKSLSSINKVPSRPQSAKTDRSSRSQSLKCEKTLEEQRAYEEYQRSFVVPRLITILKNGRRPRKAMRLLLNKKTAQSFDQVMADVSEVVKLDCGSVKKLYTLTGRQQVTCLAEFFQDDTVFLACGLEKVTSADFNLDKREICNVSAYRPFTGKHKERVTLRKNSESSISKSSGNTTPTFSSAMASSKHNTDGKIATLASDEKADGSEKFDISQVDMPYALTNKYDIGNMIGTGNFAVVLECKDKKTQRKYALKIINKEICKGKEKMIDNEVRILRCVKHPNIIRLVEDYMNQHQIFYVMELVKGGDLFDAIASSSSKYTEQDASGMLYNLASALEYLHSLHIVHRDVKPENILIRQHDDGSKSLKLGDFGLAIEVKGPLYTVCGTPTYVAPEVIAETGYGVKIDVWSAGVITYILLCGFPPFSSANDNQDELFDMIMTGNYDFVSPYWDDVTPSAKSVISGMLETDPEIRLTASQVLEHKWVASDTYYSADLRKKVSSGLSSYFRRAPKSSQKYAGIKIIASTALDKASKFFQGRGKPYDKRKNDF
ncbi:serine/threonine-protein kinase DCLK1-like isoform X3 [Physella acuta]|uniref:serine/threonine-protein kinase DCLK1-like isoform X3 n=1 Tax=Physella acuta TaxID=109671 RepID=UPI0027DC3C02|nr:serine/threonine-protein kinase DCLK1-like isoform X3 [Physella acuta]